VFTVIKCRYGYHNIIGVHLRHHVTAAIKRTRSFGKRFHNWTSGNRASAKNGRAVIYRSINKHSHLHCLIRARSCGGTQARWGSVRHRSRAATACSSGQSTAPRAATRTKTLGTANPLAGTIYLVRKFHIPFLGFPLQEEETAKRRVSECFAAKHDCGLMLIEIEMC